MSSAAAQDKAESLAQMRAELQVLAGQLQALRSELVAGGQAAIQAAGGPGALDRMNAMEAELSRLTAATEQLQLRVEKVVADGTNRVGDLEFRICELEEGCDPANLPITATIGGDAAGAVPATGGATTAPTATLDAPKVELAMNEQADFDAAKAKLDAGDYPGASLGFAQFVANYPGGPLTGEAQFLQGEALGHTGDAAGSARAYLASFSGDPAGPRAPASLLRLGAALGLLGQTQDACVTLNEVPARFPQAPEAGEARSTMQSLGCQ
ncbi:tol-pal system protein YbgF [Frigidibacter sp. SD6-1]|uniref:tol-pal system protein YbgF n=1 Tax=Frigidibacter sp. SD6-1 TaxID=3032581 RepID=UPI0024DF877C|nr:tol-pal system protein YbgF [Frigidibacter sp. SD6-1]